MQGCENRTRGLRRSRANPRRLVLFFCRNGGDRVNVRTRRIHFRSPLETQLQCRSAGSSLLYVEVGVVGLWFAKYCRCHVLRRYGWNANAQVGQHQRYAIDQDKVGTTCIHERIPQFQCTMVRPTCSLLLCLGKTCGTTVRDAEPQFPHGEVCFPVLNTQDIDTAHLMPRWLGRYSDSCIASME